MVGVPKKGRSTVRAGATTLVEQVQIRTSFQKVVFLRQKARGRKQKAGSRTVLDQSRLTEWKEALGANIERSLWKQIMEAI